MRSNIASPALVWDRIMWKFLLDSVLLESHLGKPRDDMRLSAKLKRMARSNAVNFEKEVYFGCDGQVAKQVQKVV
jgi:hypothetical protein